MGDWYLVLRGGRVIDPESGFDAVQDVAIAQGRIAAIGTALPTAPTDIDVPTWRTAHSASASCSGTGRRPAQRNTCASQNSLPRRACPPSRMRGT